MTTSDPSPLPDPIGESMSTHPHGTRYVDDEGRCLSCLASTLAATVERLEAERDAMEKRLAERYLRGGPNEQATIAELCDECLDRSGAMLGRIRAAALAARTGRAET